MNKTTHTCGGTKFGKLAPAGQCLRCDELRAGDAPRRGWGTSRKAIEAEQIRAIASHDCKRSGCGVVCTFGDW